MHLLKLVAVLCVGVLGSSFLALDSVGSSQWYAHAITFLLAIGLYGSTYSIDISHARKHLRLIVTSVAVGVVLKSFIIGAVCFAYTRDPLYWLLGVVVAQIDPLSVAALMQGSKMSTGARTILSAWSSFDDPITVLMTTSLLPLIGAVVAPEIVASSIAPAALGADYFAVLIMGLLFMVGMYWLWQVVSERTVLSRVVVAGSFPIAVKHSLMLGVAGVGLFARPKRIKRFVDNAVYIALVISIFLLGLLLSDGISWGAGALLGIAAYVSQVVVGLVMTKGLGRTDRIYIACAQQNGVTAIVLALLLETFSPGVVAIVAPAILSINVIHYFVNRALDESLS